MVTYTSEACENIIENTYKSSLKLDEAKNTEATAKWIKDEFVPAMTVIRKVYGTEFLKKILKALATLKDVDAKDSKKCERVIKTALMKANEEEMSSDEVIVASNRSIKFIVNFTVKLITAVGIPAAIAIIKLIISVSTITYTFVKQAVNLWQDKAGDNDSDKRFDSGDEGFGGRFALNDLDFERG